MKIIFAVIILFLSVNCFGSNMESGKEDTQKLFDSVLSLAKQLLLENDEFFPFGEVMKSNGEQVSLAASNDDERPMSSELIEILKNHFVASAQAKEIIASSLVYDVRVKGSDAIAIDLDHINGYSVTVFIPYELKSSELITGEIFTIEGKGAIFK